METVEGLIMPLVIVASASIYFFRIIGRSGAIVEAPTVVRTGMLSVNIFRGRNSQTLSVDSAKTPRDIASQLFSAEELKDKQAIIVCNGRRLNNDLPIGSQGVSDGSFLHTQLADYTQIERRSDKSHSLITLIISFMILSIFWWGYFTNPQYFSFLSKTLLLSFSELLIFYIYRKWKLR